MSLELGVAIVTFNSADVIGTCLEACRNLRTVVVDNASVDDTLEVIRRYAGVEVVANQDNLGFAAAVNQAVRQLGTDFVLLLNPDVCLLTNPDPLVQACRKPGVGMSCGQLLDPKGRPQRGFSIRRLPSPLALICEVLGVNRLFPWNPVNRHYRCLDLDLTQPADVEQPAGAFLLFRRDLWDRLGGFDTQFAPIWFEDVDFCKRALALGSKIRYLPRVTATHQGGNSISKVEWASRERYWYGSLLRYAHKHFRCSTFRVLSAAVVLGSVCRAAVAVAHRRSSDPLQAYAQVIHLAAASVVRGDLTAPAMRSGSGSAEGSSVRKAKTADSRR